MLRLRAATCGLVIHVSLVLVSTMCATNSTKSEVQSSGQRDLPRFLAGGGSKEADARRNSTFKLIPRITEGSWIIKQSVGSTPCLLGNKLKAHYYQGPGYMEVDIDVASSSVAASVVGMVHSATKSLVIDLAIVLEGHTADELPESLLGTVRLNHLDLSTAQHLDVATQTVLPQAANGHRRTNSASRRGSKAT